MVKFKNILTKHIFILPEDKALEVIKQAPDIYEIISGLDNNIITTHINHELESSKLKDIYNIVIEEDELEVDLPSLAKEKAPKVLTKNKKTEINRTAVKKKKEKNR